ncbi:MAG: deoxyguanosinetriphosphate triphosphohydrolase [Thermodesulfobacteriota bacterium]
MSNLIREEMEAREAKTLSEFACLSRDSKGRYNDEPECDIRPAFQRDRDRIIHAKTFRRLKHKTQVFLAPAGDHYRTRLTHVLEVAQIARTMAAALRLNENLAEAIALAHDLGHTPFGHAGESVLNELHPGGFRHYEQSLRVVEILEKKGQGLNLTNEVREGILKHSKGLKDVLPDDMDGMPATREGQLVRVADIIAYVNHDLDDAIRAGILAKDSVPTDINKLLGRSNSARIGAMVRDLITNTAPNGGERLIMSKKIMRAISDLRDFLYENVYEAHRVHNDFVKGQKILKELYDYFKENDGYFDDSICYSDDTTRERKVCDFIAGMTDQYALDTYTNIFLPQPWSVK